MIRVLRTGSLLRWALACAVCALAFRSVVAAASVVVSDRTVCSQEGWWDIVFDDERLRSAPLSNPALDVALTTHGTVDRLGAVAAACAEWQGPLHFALYLSPALERRTGRGRGWKHVSPGVGIERFWGPQSRKFVSLEEQREAAVAAVNASACLGKHATLHVVRPSADEWDSAGASDAARRATLHSTYGLHNVYAHYPMNTMRNAAAEGARRAGHLLHLVVDADLAIVTGGGGCREVSEQAWGALARAARPVEAAAPRNLRYGISAPFPLLDWGDAVVVLPVLQVPKATRRPVGACQDLPRRRSLWTAASIVAAIDAKCATHYYNPLVYPYDLRNVTVRSRASAFFADDVSRDPRYDMHRHTVDWGRSMENYFIAPLVNGGPTPFDERFVGRHLDKISWFHDQRAGRPLTQFLRIADVARGPFIVNEGPGGSLTGDSLDSDTNAVRSNIHDGLLLAKASPVATIFAPRYMFADARSPTTFERVSVTLAESWTGARRAAVLSLSLGFRAGDRQQPWCLGADEFEGEVDATDHLDSDGASDSRGFFRHPRAVADRRRTRRMRERRAAGHTWRASCPAGGRVAHCPAPDCLICVPSDEASDDAVRLATARLCDMSKLSARRRNPGWNCTDVAERFQRAGRRGTTDSDDHRLGERVELATLLTIRMYQDACYEPWLHRACGVGGVAKAVNCANSDHRRWFSDAGAR